MDYGTAPLLFAFLYFFGSIFVSVIMDPETWEPADVSKPDIGHQGAEQKAFSWSLMMNQNE